MSEFIAHYICIYCKSPIDGKNEEETLRRLKKYLRIKIYNRDNKKIKDLQIKLRKSHVEVDLGKSYKIRGYKLLLDNPRYKGCVVDVVFEDNKGHVVEEYLNEKLRVPLNTQ